jgi:hypothetical protein
VHYLSVYLRVIKSYDNYEYSGTYEVVVRTDNRKYILNAQEGVKYDHGEFYQDWVSASPCAMTLTYFITQNTAKLEGIYEGCTHFKMRN